MSEIMSENKLSMLISEPMEASADMGATACNTKASQSILLDAGPLQRVWCRPRKLGIPRLVAERSQLWTLLFGVLCSNYAMVLRRYSWLTAEGTCAGYNGYPSDPVSDGLDSITGQNIQNQAVDNHPDSAVKV